MALRQLIIAVVLGMAVSGSLTATVSAGSRQLSVFEDNRMLVESGPAMREAALDEIRGLGATTVRVLVRWSRLAPAPGSKTRPRVDLDDPASYTDWSPYDGIVLGAQSRGLQVLLNPSGPGPRWASQCRHPGERPGACMPRVSDYKAFVHALGRRYGGAYVVEGVTLPHVSTWSFWNEPNHKAWLYPQIVHRRYVGAARYRDLAHAGIAALRATGHGRSDVLLLGETAPVGGSAAIPPLDFYRSLLCLDGRRCTSSPRFTVNGVAHHPYTSGASAAPAYVGRRGDVTIASLDRLTILLDQAARRGRLPHGLPVYLTEFGYQTRPPDPFGVTLAQQAAYLNWSDYVGYNNRRVAAVGQYELRDDADPHGFNTGLRFANGKPKPALAAYALPIWVAPSGRTQVRVFGLARAAHSLPATVEIQNRRSSSGRFRTVATATTNSSGYFMVRLPAAGRYWRLALVAAPKTRFSRIATTP